MHQPIGAEIQIPSKLVTGWQLNHFSKLMHFLSSCDSRLKYIQRHHHRLSPKIEIKSILLFFDRIFLAAIPPVGTCHHRVALVLRLEPNFHSLHWLSSHSLPETSFTFKSNPKLHWTIHLLTNIWFAVLAKQAMLPFLGINFYRLNPFRTGGLYWASFYIWQ